MFGSKSYLTFNTFSQLFKHKTTYTSIHGTTHAPPHPPIPLAPSSAHPAQVPKRARPLLSLPSGGTWNSWSSCASVEAELQIARTPVGGPHDDASTRPCRIYGGLPPDLLLHSLVCRLRDLPPSRARHYLLPLLASPAPSRRADGASRMESSPTIFMIQGFPCFTLRDSIAGGKPPEPEGRGHAPLTNGTCLRS
jgi:hypothetical protein